MADDDSFWVVVIVIYLFVVFCVCAPIKEKEQQEQAMRRERRQREEERQEALKIRRVVEEVLAQREAIVGVVIEVADDEMQDAKDALPVGAVVAS